VHMRLDKTMASILVKIAPDYRHFINNDGTIVVELKLQASERKIRTIWTRCKPV